MQTICAVWLVLIAAAALATPASGARAIHYEAADISIAPATRFSESPAATLVAGIVPRRFQRAPLPHIVRRSGVADPALISTWYRLRYGGAPSRDAVYFYAPRWQVTGKLAVYADGRLVYAPRSGPQWMSFNVPLWIKLAEAGGPPPAEVLIHIVSQRSSGGGISSVWIGDESALAWRNALRHWIQVDLTIAISALDLILGGASLILWVWWRRERSLLLLAAAALFNLVWEVQFRTGEAALPLSEPWFGWMTTCALEWWILASYLFGLEVIGVRSNAVRRALVAFTLLFTITAMPDLGPVSALVSADLSPLLDEVTLAGVVTMTVTLWAAYTRRPSHEGLVICLYNMLWPFAGMHDVLLQNYRIGIETICLAPLAFGLLLFAMVYILVRRYVLAVRALDGHAQLLEERVRAREAELEISHTRLREVERRKTIATERQRLMRDMHDGMGSALMGALAAVERGRLGELDVAQLLRECIDDLKLTIDSMEVEDADLPLVLATLRYRLAPRFEQAGIEIQWQISDVPTARLDPERAMHVLRIVQEIFTNIVKHARARTVTVSIAIEAGTTVLIVEDDGIGFKAEPASFRGKRGLSNISHRATIIGAVANWTSRPGATRHELRLPVD